MQLTAKYKFYGVDFTFTMTVPEKETDNCHLAIDGVKVDYHTKREAPIAAMESVIYEEMEKAKEWVVKHKKLDSPIQRLINNAISWGFKHS